MYGEASADPSHPLIGMGSTNDTYDDYAPSKREQVYAAPRRRFVDLSTGCSWNSSQPIQITSTFAFAVRYRSRFWTFREFLIALCADASKREAPFNGHAPYAVYEGSFDTPMSANRSGMDLDQRAVSIWEKEDHLYADKISCPLLAIRVPRAKMAKVQGTSIQHGSPYLDFRLVRATASCATFKSLARHKHVSESQEVDAHSVCEQSAGSTRPWSKWTRCADRGWRVHDRRQAVQRHGAWGSRRRRKSRCAFKWKGCRQTHVCIWRYG